MTNNLFFSFKTFLKMLIISINNFSLIAIKRPFVCDALKIWQLKLQDFLISIVKGILMFNKHLLFILINFFVFFIVINMWIIPEFLYISEQYNGILSFNLVSTALSEYYLAIAILSVTLFYYKNPQFNYLAIIVIILYCFLLIKQNFLFLSNFVNFNNSFHNYFIILLFKLVIGISSLIYLIFVQQLLTDQKLNYFEYYILILISILLFFLLCCSDDLLTAYFSLELQSLSLYVFASFKRSSNYSIESAIKYFILGSSATIIFLFGSNFVYCVINTISLIDLKDLFRWFFSANIFFLSFESISRALDSFHEKTFRFENDSIKNLQTIYDKFLILSTTENNFFVQEFDSLEYITVILTENQFNNSQRFSESLISFLFITLVEIFQPPNKVHCSPVNTETTLTLEQKEFKALAKSFGKYYSSLVNFKLGNMAYHYSDDEVRKIRSFRYIYGFSTRKAARMLEVDKLIFQANLLTESLPKSTLNLLRRQLPKNSLDISSPFYDILTIIETTLPLKNFLLEQQMPYPLYADLWAEQNRILHGFNPESIKLLLLFRRFIEVPGNIPIMDGLLLHISESDGTSSNNDLLYEIDDDSGVSFSEGFRYGMPWTYFNFVNIDDDGSDSSRESHVSLSFFDDDCGEYEPHPEPEYFFPRFVEVSPSSRAIGSFDITYNSENLNEE